MLLVPLALTVCGVRGGFRRVIASGWVVTDVGLRPV
jgi:hypothetical protein